MTTPPPLLDGLLGGYPAPLQDQARQLLAEGRLGDYLARRYPEAHAVRNDGALYAHAMALERRHLRNARPLAKVVFDNRLQIDQRALGTLTAASRVQGGRLTAKRELRVAALFKDAPAAMLEMIVVHELAHLRHRAHDKAFYALCEHMLAGYHQVEFDTRLYQAWRAAVAQAAAGAAPPAVGAGTSAVAPAFASAASATGTDPAGPPEG